jgi:hypothetical protein
MVLAMRWPLLRRGSRVTGRPRQKFDAMLISRLATGPRLGIEGNLFSLLALQIRDLVYGEPRRLG